ncbi:MAG: signal peptidase II [Dehalococcoidales bacterium]|nr:signal peptidase II [Dehalococcoidales bacterium]
MRRVNSLQNNRWSLVIFFAVTLLIVAADQISKFWIRSTLVIGESLFEFGFFSFTRINNTGAAFGLFQEQSLLLTIVDLLSVVILFFLAIFYYRRIPFLNNMLSRLALGLVLGGTVGNLIDRIYLGHVTDFINVSFFSVFNIADSAIVIGAILLAYSLFNVTVVRKS